MSENYKPGTVAVATVRGVPNVRVVKSINGSAYWLLPLGGPEKPTRDVAYGTEVTDVRPLVVLDIHPNAPAIKTGSLVQHLRDGYFDRVADQIEEQTKLPKPEEPTGLGAVVEDAEGERWVRWTYDDRKAAWRGEHHERWSCIDAVRVLSPGIES